MTPSTMPLNVRGTADDEFAVIPTISSKHLSSRGSLGASLLGADSLDRTTAPVIPVVIGSRVRMAA